MTTSSLRLIAALLLGLLFLFFLVPALNADTDPLKQIETAIEEQRYADALALLMPLAEEGNAEALNTLGGLHAQGWGVAQDFTKAREWFEKRAEREWSSPAAWSTTPGRTKCLPSAPQVRDEPASVQRSRCRWTHRPSPIRRSRPVRHRHEPRGGGEPRFANRSQSSPMGAASGVGSWLASMLT